MIRLHAHPPGSITSFVKGIAGHLLITEIVYFSNSERVKFKKSYAIAFSVVDRPGVKGSNHEFDARSATTFDVREHGQWLCLM